MGRIPVNTPNMLTMARFALVPAVTVLIYFDIMMPALSVYFLACVTDLLDGYIARKKNLITNEGKLLDPLADKLMSVFAVISFTVIGVLPLFILIIILVKELMMIGGGIYLYFKGVVIPSNMFGKIAAFSFNTAVGFTFLHKIVPPLAYIIFLCAALAMMIAALLQYAYLNIGKKLWSKKEESS